MESPRPPGKTTIDSGVLLTIARLTALEVEGVSRMGEVPGSVRGMFRRNQDQGVRIDVEDGMADVEIYVILAEDTEIRKVSKEIQSEVARAISEMVGMEVGRINIHIDDIDYISSQETAETS